MKYLKKFNENKSSNIFEVDWSKFLPDSLTIITDNGEFKLDRKAEKSIGTEHDVDVINLMNCIQINYQHKTVDSKDGDVTADGEPDQLEFDITLVKDNDGSSSNPSKSLRLNIEVTYGDAMVYHFTIDYPNKVKVVHYTGKNSLYDKETHFGFSDDSLKELVFLFNSFGFNTTPEDFKFIDSDLDSYYYVVPIEKGNKLEPMMMNDEEKIEIDGLKGGDKIVKYNQFKSNK